MIRSDLPWLEGRVPDGFWDIRDNRRRYLFWLTGRFGFQQPEDCYQLRRRHFAQNYGGGLLKNVYHDSILAVLQDCRPEVDWKPWRMGGVPNRFWDDATHRSDYMSWLQERLGYSQPEDWYRVRKFDFYRNSGGGLLNRCYGDSPQLAVREFLPDVNWQPWLFHSVPQDFWQSHENRLKYLLWLGERLDNRTADDWHRLKTSDLKLHRGGGLLDYYYSGPIFRAVSQATGVDRGPAKSRIWPLIQFIENSVASGALETLYGHLPTRPSTTESSQPSGPLPTRLAT